MPQAVVKSVCAPGSASRYHRGPDAGEGLLYPPLLLFLVHDELRRLHVRRVDVQVRRELKGKEGAPANAAAALTEKLKKFIKTNIGFQLELVPDAADGGECPPNRREAPRS